jgi:hypothetical protein
MLRQEERYAASASVRSKKPQRSSAFEVRRPMSIAPGAPGATT